MTVDGRRRLWGALLSCAVIAYAWCATGVHAFSASAYVAVAVPSLVALVSYGVLGGFSTRRTDLARYYRTRARDSSWSSVAPWATIALLAVILESIGLALGGRSSTVPTLSTTLDHLLVDHWGRALLFIAWILVGASPLRRLILRGHS